MLDAAIPTVRAARREDIPLLAHLAHEATLPPSGRSFWTDLLEGTGAEARGFLEALLAVGGSNWGNVEDFLILEVDGAPAAGCAVFPAEDGPARASPLDLAKLSGAADWLAWPRSTRTAFEAAFRAMWDDGGPFLAPRAPAIVETVAVLPGHRGEGLGHRLMRAAKDRARALGADALGVSVVRGNEPARRLYERHFEPWATLHPACFGGAFPGLVEFRSPLGPADEPRAPSGRVESPSPGPTAQDRWSRPTP